MSKKKKLLKCIKQEVENNSLYLWGGQGEPVLTTTPEKIVNMETGNVNSGRVLATLAERIRKGKITAASKYFDCSGLLVYFMLKLGLIKYDMNANSLMHLCENVRDISLVKNYDLVFQVTDGKAVHVGYYYDGIVYESRGRDYGVGAWALADRKSFNTCGTWKW